MCFVIIRNQVKFPSSPVFPSHRSLLTGPGVSSKQNYHGAWSRTQFFILLIFICGSCSCSGKCLFIGGPLGLWLDTRHLQRRAKRHLLLETCAFRASNLTETEVQQDTQWEEQNKRNRNVSFLSTSAEISIALTIWL